MATNLNIENRGQITEVIINKTFHEKAEALKAKRVALADAIYFEIVPKEFIALAATPGVPQKGWFVTVEYVDQNRDLSSMTIASIKESVRDDHARMSESRPIPYDKYHSWHRTLSTMNASDRCKALIAAFNDEVKQYLEEKKLAQGKLHALLYSVRTVEKLIEVAPELADFIPEQLKKPKPQLPAIKSGDVIATLVKAGLKLGA